MNELEIFEALNGKPLHVGMSVTVDPSNEYAADWQGQFVVLGINFERSHSRAIPGKINVTLGDGWDDSGSDGWSPEDLRPAL